ncbi:hypothetical protein NC652_020255 [Populus alba x Populus x berolinensis]|uniref:Uncharacterized protein n=1 Tax=Populus alba x Populus x berolinensis TaxID=444605 RepID=A0AAD6PXJ0_9ROSI|nr:hypothetical protein NC652_020255 [Populus alba x Populus x berolinensis]KAJ6970310.1 hypothetical protein NC653_034800 [Populus alba x Populus x berolinensis]
MWIIHCAYHVSGIGVMVPQPLG